MKNKHRDKIVVIGAGNVGEAIAYTLMVRVQANDIVLIDVNADRAKGAAIDIAPVSYTHLRMNFTAFMRQRIWSSWNDFTESWILLQKDIGRRLYPRIWEMVHPFRRDTWRR